MNKVEYIKCFWEYIDDETPILLFYEVDLENERYATRMVEVLPNRKVNAVTEEGFDYITEAPVPVIEEMNQEPEFFAEIISKDEFEKVYGCEYYVGNIVFPR